jgi:hypothetical protein
MSAQRLYQLKETLESRGWYITNINDIETWYALTSVSDDGDLSWKTYKKHKLIILNFFLITHLGDKTPDLRDIIYVNPIYSDESMTLFFSKIKSEEWKNDLLEFVYSLDFISNN